MSAQQFFSRNEDGTFDLEYIEWARMNLETVGVSAFMAGEKCSAQDAVLARARARQFCSIGAHLLGEFAQLVKDQKP